MVKREETPFFKFCDQNEVLICMPQYRMKPWPQMSYDLVFQINQGTIFSYNILKTPKARQKNDFGFVKVQVL